MPQPSHGSPCGGPVAPLPQLTKAILLFQDALDLALLDHDLSELLSIRPLSSLAPPHDGPPSLRLTPVSPLPVCSSLPGCAGSRDHWLASRLRSRLDGGLGAHTVPPPAPRTERSAHLSQIKMKGALWDRHVGSRVRWLRPDLLAV